MSTSRRQRIDITDDVCGTCEFWPGERRVVRGEPGILECEGGILECSKKGLRRQAKSLRCRSYIEWSMTWTGAGGALVKDPNSEIVDAADGLCGSCEDWIGDRIVLSDSKGILQCSADRGRCKRRAGKYFATDSCKRYWQWKSLVGSFIAEETSKSSGDKRGKSCAQQYLDNLYETLDRRKRAAAKIPSSLSATEKSSPLDAGPFAGMKRLDNNHINLKKFTVWILNNWDSEQVVNQIQAILFSLGMEREERESGKNSAKLYTQLQDDIQTKKFWKQLYLVLDAEYDTHRQLHMNEKIVSSNKPKTLADEGLIFLFADSFLERWNKPEFQLIKKSFSSGVEEICNRTSSKQHPWKPLVEETSKTVMQIEFWYKIFFLTGMKMRA